MPDFRTRTRARTRTCARSPGLAALFSTLCLLAGHGPSQAAGPCGATALGSAKELVQCIQQQPLMDDLAAFQALSDAHPGPDGHGNRDTLSPGYLASVDHLAALMRQAGYQVTVQAYPFPGFQVLGQPQLRMAGRSFALGSEWHVARLSGAGTVNAPVQALAGTAQAGCEAADFAGFLPGRVALLAAGRCELDDQVQHAQQAGAAAVVVYQTAEAAPRRKGLGAGGAAYEGRLHEATSIPVVAVAALSVGQALLAAEGPLQLAIQTQVNPGTDYNLIADSPLGDPRSVVVVDAHLDAIYGAGILDNASGSASILEIALAMAKTPTRHQLRYIWFGGEELGLFGSRYYTRKLLKHELNRIVFDIDADVTGSPNYAVLVADPGHAHNADRFPPNVVPDSQRGNQYFTDFFQSVGLPSRMAAFGNSGTDSNAFSRVGVPNTGVLTQQNCCKSKAEVQLWGGVTGNYEGRIPSRDGGCVDHKHRWCDNIDNIDPLILTQVSQALAHVTYRLANDPALDRQAAPR
jgi:hypothetical protein